jgi:hypothetical protein
MSRKPLKVFDMDYIGNLHCKAASYLNAGSRTV